MAISALASRQVAQGGICNYPRDSLLVVHFRRGNISILCARQIYLETRILYYWYVTNEPHNFLAAEASPLCSRHVLAQKIMILSSLTSLINFL